MTTKPTRRVSRKPTEELSQKLSVSEFLIKPKLAIRTRLYNLGYNIVGTKDTLNGSTIWEREVNDPTVQTGYGSKTNVEITASQLLPLDTSSQTKMQILEELCQKVRSIKKHLEDV